MADASWFVGQGGEQKGPFAQDALKEMLARGEVAPTDLVWKEGMASWVPASDVAELQPPAPAAAPEPAPAPEPSPPLELASEPAAAPSSGASWFVGQGGQQKGPYSADALKGMLARGEVRRGDVIWKEGMAQWVPAGEVAEFADALKSAPPPMPGPPPGPAAPSPAANFLKEFWDDLHGIFVDPPKGLEAAAEKRPPIFAIVWIALNTLLVALLKLQVVEMLRAPRSVEGAFRALGEAMGSGIALGGGGGGGAEVFFKSLLMQAVSYGIGFGLLMLVLSAILRVPESWEKALAVLGLSSVPLALAGVAAFVFGWLNLWFQVLVLAATPASIIVAYYVFVHTSKAPRRIALYAVPAIYFVMALIESGISRF